MALIRLLLFTLPLAFLAAPLAADCVSIETHHSQIATVLSNSHAAGFDENVLSCLHLSLSNQTAQSGSNPPCYSVPAFKLKVSAAFAQCLDRFANAILTENIVHNAKLRVAMAKKASCADMLKRKPKNQGAVSPAVLCKLNKCVRKRGGGKKAFRRCIRKVDLVASSQCHCWSGCHFCCILNYVGGYSSCWNDQCTATGPCY